MANRLEGALSWVLTIATCAIAVVAGTRELRARSRPPVRADAPPQLRTEWREFAKIGRRLGSPTAEVTITEFADFECPFCMRFAKRYNGLKAKYGDKLSLVFVHDPLTSIHRFAAPAARAAECAAEQGRFESYHDALYAAQDSLGLKPWSAYAVVADVRDTVGFAKCIRDRVQFPLIEAGSALASKLGVRGTPTILVNEWQYAQVPSDSALEAAIKDALAGKRPAHD